MSYAPQVEPMLYQLGYLTLNQSGAILSSGGDLENDEEKAEILYRLISMHSSADKFLNDGCTRLSVNFKDHAYVICLSNKKIHIIKKRVNIANDEDSFVVNTNVSITNSINA